MNQEFINEIKNIIEPDRVLCDEPMSSHTTFRIGGPADIYVSVGSENEIVTLVGLLRERQIPYFIIGKGSNLLVSDAGFRGVIIEIGTNYSGLDIKEDRIIAKSGTPLVKLSHFAMEHGLAGLEFASGIPGTVGGGIIMNAGAYGGEMAQVAYSVKLLDADGNIVVLSNEEMKFEYRNSRAKKEGLIVLEAEFLLNQGNPEAIDGIMRDLNMKRRDKQPLEYPSAGSTFKRPEGNFAGKLISDAGLKGFSIGGAQVSEKHAGFLINKDKSTAEDMYALINSVRDKVEHDFGITLEPEVILLGEFA